MPLDIPCPLNNAVNNQLAHNVVDICLDNTLQILSKSQLEKFEKMTT